MKKGFTIIELVAVITILGIISMVAVTAYNSYTESARESYYKDAEKSMKASAESLITYCASSLLATPGYCVDLPASGSSVSISVSTLVNNKFLDEIFDQRTDASCSGEVTITNNTEAGSTNKKLDYKVCLRCNSYKSSGC